MNKSLYTEAIEAAEQIKLSTEEKVKQQIIESISPQVRRMVEKKLFEDTSSCDNESTQESVDVDNEETSSKDKDQSIKLNSESRRILNKLINNNSKKEYAFNKIASLRESLRSLQKAIILAENSKDADISKPRIVLLYKNLVNEISNLKTNSIIKSNNEVLNEFYKLSKELDNMSKRQSNNRFLNESLESLLEMDLFEAEESDESTEEISFLDDEENMEDAEETEDADADADVEETEDADAEDDDAPLSKDTTVEELARMAGILQDEEEESLEIDESLFETSEMSTQDAEETEDADAEDQEGIVDAVFEGSSSSHDRVLEIDENMLRKEIGKMKAIRESDAKDMASHFGGGSLEGEMFVDGVELNKLHEMKTKAAKVVRKNRILESKLSQYKKALQGMKGQLLEMNLFNAKLLYANKLMQNRELSIKQQRNIVESLDEAKTLGEAKILFESLSKSLVSNRKSGQSNLTESTTRRSTGSSSTSVRSGQAKPLTESVALDRWATLAGIRQ